MLASLSADSSVNSKDLTPKGDDPKGGVGSGQMPILKSDPQAPPTVHFMPPSLEDYRRRVANITIGSSTLRNQGARGVIDIARNFLAGMEFQGFHGNVALGFLRELDRQTNLLIDAFPSGAKNWGTLRKAVNLYL